MTDICPTDILTRGPNGRLAAKLAYNILNDAGEGFDPTGEDGWELVREPVATDDLTVYTHTDEEGDEWVVLVGTDGVGEGAWAVRVGDAGVCVP